MVKKRELEVNITIQEAYDLFEQEKIAQGRSKQCYYEELKYMLNIMGLRFDDYVSVISEQMFNKYVCKMLESHLSASSVNHNIRSVRVILYSFMDKQLLNCFKIHLVKVQEEKVKYCTDEEIKKLLEKKTDDFAECRTYAIICFILSTGARSSTITNLKIEDVDFKNGLITYRHTKNKYVQTVPLTNKILRIIQDYLSKWDTESDYLFPDIKSGKLTTNALRHSFRAYCKRRDMRIIYPHELRHTFARLFVMNGGDSLILQKFLGHSDLTMTKRYVRLFGNDLRNSGFEKYIALDTLTNNASRTKTIRRIA